MSTPTTHSSTSSAPARKRRWPDMSHYGIYFGVVDMPNGEPRMVMVDEHGAWGALAKRMGFAQSRWFGLYVKNSLKLDIPGFAANFPSAKVVELTSEEIRQRILPLILQRKDQRLSQMGGRRLSWHPSRTAQEPAQREDEEEKQAINPEVALRQTLVVGSNYMGQEVFESGDGLRFVRSGDAVVAREAAEARPDPLFLRASSDEDLVQVAAGMVQEIVAGKRLHSEDFIRYVEAVQGPGAAEDKEYVSRFHAALDTALRARVESVAGASKEAFDEALRLHEGRPTFWRAAGTMATPLPISVVMQSLAAARAQSTPAADSPAIIDITSNPSSHSWSLAAASISGGEIPSHDIALAGVFGRPMPHQSVAGVRVTRTDTQALLQSLDKRAPDGLTVFLMTTDHAGRLDNEFRRVISAIGQNYEVCGLTDIDAAMIGPGSETSSRIVVIGRKREAPDYTFALSPEVSVAYDYQSLWNWGEALRAAQFGEIQTFGDDGREENRWQAPYIPSSQVSEPTAMSPRNLLGPVRKALADIVSRYGMGIDELVCDKLGWTMAELEERLDAEQTDAVAIGIQAIDNGMGFVEADATGLGKGRVAAALALYAKRKGMPAMFMTETTDLFSDFYRDVADIGSMSELGNPFIINNDLVVRDADRKVIARSPSRELASVTLACGEAPRGFDVTLATYSQFNRKYDAAQAVRNTQLARAMRDLLDGAVEPYAVLQANAGALGLPDYAALGFADAVAAISYERNNASANRAGSPQVAAEADARAALLELDAQALAKHLSTQVKSDLTTLKHQWLYSGAMKGCLLILDESHRAAGEDSQTGVNIRQLVEDAGAVAYSSATFAKGISNFLLYSRLFPSTMRVATIADTLDRGGEPMQEILCAMLAEDGRLVRREHDLSALEFRVSQDTGRVERNEFWANGFAKVLAHMSYLSGEVAEIAEKMNAPMLEALKKAKAAAKAKNPGQHTVAPAAPMIGVQYTNFSSRFYNLSRAFMMSINADQAADLAIKALKEGRKPVITVENTMETVLKELVDGVELDAAAGDAAAGAAPGQDAQDQLALADPLALADLELASAADPLAGVGADAGGSSAHSRRKEETVAFGRNVTFKDILKAYVDSMFSATEQERRGNKVLKSKRISLSTPALEAAAQELHKVIDAMPDVALSPIDLVRDRITAAGYTVEEISGRRLRLTKTPDGLHCAVRMGARNKQDLKRAFNNGGLDALVLSKSGSTGISLHASRTFADQSQRVLVELQPAAAIDTRLQFWGRVNRKGQVCSPVINMLSSGLPSEKRLITMQNAKLRKMSANISGNADNSAIDTSAPDILNKIGNEVCFRWLEANPTISSILGYKIGEMPEEQARWSGTKFVDMLTGRIMMLDVDTQHRVYEEITAEFNALIEQYENEGRNPLKAAEYDLRARKTATKTLQVASGLDSVFNACVQATELTYEIKLGAIDAAEAQAAAAAGHEALRAQWGSKYAARIGDECLAAMEAVLPAMLPKRFNTLEEALADEKPNAVRNAKYKFTWLAELLPRVQPGSIIAVGSELVSGGAGKKMGYDSEMGGLERIYVTGWKVPATNRLSLAGYKLEGYSSRTRKKVEMSLSALLARPSLWVEESFKGKVTDSYKREIDLFFEWVSVPVVGHEKRIVLEGNLFRAAEIAEAQKQGAAITYSDEKGVWHHAVLLPKPYTMRNVFDLPITVDSVDTLVAAFASAGPKDDLVRVSDDFRDGQVRTHSYRVYGNSNSISVTASSTDSDCAWLLNDTAIKRCLVNGDFGGQRTKREGVVMSGMESQFLDAFMSAANAASARVLLDGYMRDWYNTYLLERTGQAEANSALVEAAMHEQDAELGALLAAPAM